MSDLRALLRRYERAQEAADRTGRELADAIRTRAMNGPRGELSRCAEELGWTRGRLNAWMSRAGRDAEPALTGSEAARPDGAKVSRRTEPNRTAEGDA